MRATHNVRLSGLRALALSLAVALLVAACGGGGEGGDSDAVEDDEPATTTESTDEAAAASDEEVTLRFVWFEWPPAQTLEDFANEHYAEVNPNVSFEVETVPFGQWHDAIFTQFAAGETTFDIPILDSQFIGEA